MNTSILLLSWGAGVLLLLRVSEVRMITVSPKVRLVSFFLACSLGVSFLYGCNGHVSIDDKRVDPEQIKMAFNQLIQNDQQLASAIKELQTAVKFTPEPTIESKKEAKK